MIYDLILILIFILLIIIGAYRGAAKSLAGIITSIISYFAAASLGKILSVWIYDSMLRPAIDKAVADAINNIGSNAASSFNDSVPAWLGAILNTAGIDIPGIVTGNLAAASFDAATSAVHNAVMPVVIGLLTFILTIVLFIVIGLLLRFLVMKPVLGVFELPGISFINRVLGGVIGFIDAFLIVSLLAYLLKLLLPNISSESWIFNESTIYNSFIFYHFYSGNIFTVLLSWIGL